MKYLAAFLSIFFIGAIAAAQSPTPGALDQDINKLFDREKTGTDAFASPAVLDKLIYERAVNPDTYLCGAGDVLTMTMLFPLTLQYQMPVSADGAVNIPKYGTVLVNKKTIRQAEKDIQAALAAKNAMAKVSLSLFKPRSIYVTVRGEVESPGLLAVNAATPVSIAVELANAPTESVAKRPNLIPQPLTAGPTFPEQLRKQFFGEPIHVRRSMRRIVVRHADGSVVRADIPKYNATRDERLNPLLREGDEIVVPKQSDDVATIGIYGAVRYPGEFEFIDGDDVATLVALGFGVDEKKNATKAELIRVTAAGGRESLALSPNELASNHTPLRAGDRLIVHAAPNRVAAGVVAVKGEVVLPGVYPIQPGVTTLTELVRLAGGFTREAYPSQCELYRAQTNADGSPADVDREYTRNLHLSFLTLEDSLYYKIEARAQEGFVSVDFHSLFALNDANADVPVVDGDVLIVPRNTMSVQIVGQVARGGFIPWVKGKKLSFYIERAGGYLEDASEGRASVLKGNTRAWLDPSDTEIEPGDLIWIHRNPMVRASNTSEVMGVIASVIAGLAGIASLAITVFRK